MAEFPALPLFTDAYLGDTNHLTTIEHGAYLLLLITAWRTRDCRLPDDDKLLARFVRASPVQWAKLRPVLAPFFKIGGGFWVQGRLSDERAFVKRQRDAQKRAGQASALKRKERASTTVSAPLTVTDNPHTHTHTYKEEREEARSVSTKTDIPISKLEIDKKTEVLEAFKTYNTIAAAVGWPACARGGTQRDAKMRQRLADAKGLEGWKAALERASRSPFLRGETKRADGHESWRPNIDFFLQAAKFTKLTEGAYDGPNAGKTFADSEKATSERRSWLANDCYGLDGRWIKNRSTEIGAWSDLHGVGPPPHDPRTLVSDSDLERFPKAKAMRDKLRGKQQ